MDLTNTTSRELGSALDRAGLTWSYDGDGDVVVRIRSGLPPGTDVVFYEIQPDFSIRGHFLNARATPLGNGKINWEVSLDSGYRPTAVAQKVVTVYLMPRKGHVDFQIHASVVPLDQPRPMHIKVIPESQQVSWIESEFPGLRGVADDYQLWLAGGLSDSIADERAVRDFIQTASKAGLAMFDGPFTGWIDATLTAE